MHTVSFLSGSGDSYPCHLEIYSIDMIYYSLQPLHKDKYSSPTKSMAQYSVLGEFSQRALNDDEEQNGNYAVRNNYPGDELFLEKTHCLGPKLPFYRQYYKSFAVNAILLTCNIIFFLVVWKRFQPKCLHGVYGPELIYSMSSFAPLKCMQIT